MSKLFFFNLRSKIEILLTLSSYMHFKNTAGLKNSFPKFENTIQKELRNMT